MLFRSARAGFAQAIKAVMDGDEAPDPVDGPKEKAPKAKEPKVEVSKGPELVKNLN